MCRAHDYRKDTRDNLTKVIKGYTGSLRKLSKDNLQEMVRILDSINSLIVNGSIPKKTNMTHKTCKCTTYNICRACEEIYQYEEENTFYHDLCIDFLPKIWIYFGITIPLKKDIKWTGILGTHITIQSKTSKKILLGW